MMHRLNKAAATLPIILVCGCGGGGGTGTQSSPDPPVNTTPVAEAGTSSAFDAGDLVTLDCSGSSDPQGDQLSFRWRQLDGPLVQLSDEKACNPGFTAPDATTPVTFELTVSDSLFDSSDRVTHQIRAPLPIPAIRFAEFGTDAGIAPYSMAIGPHAGVAAEDFDGDGFVDLFVPNGLGVPDQLYKNNGDGTFVDVAAVVGLDLVQNHRSALWIDYDGDHDLDLIIGGDCRADPVVLDECDDPENLWLYRQSSMGTFEDVSETAGLNVAWGGTANWHRGGVSAGDINNDGYLDIFVIGWGDRAYLFRNNTDGSFSDVTLDTNITVDNYFYQQGVFHDFDRDGWTDLYVAVDGLVPNRLYRNEMNDTFTDIASAAKVDYASTDMGIALGDIDNDGAIDIYVTEISQVLGDEFHHNQLYRNTTSGTSPDYAEVSQSLGVQNGFWGWGATFIDYDNDGWQDLATTNGKNKPGWSTDRSKFWRNSGISGRPFDDVSSHAGFDDSFIGAGLISFDFDRDGDLDLVQTTSEGGSLRVLRNDARPTSQTSRNYVVVRPRMSGTNHWAIGAVVTVEVGALKMTRVITAGTSTDSQEPAEAHFGLGDNPVVDRLVIDWPGGSRTSYVDLAANRVHDIVLQ